MCRRRTSVVGVEEVVLRANPVRQSYTLAARAPNILAWTKSLDRYKDKVHDTRRAVSMKDQTEQVDGSLHALLELDDVAIVSHSLTSNGHMVAVLELRVRKSITDVLADVVEMA
jgi:hypothetical protein